MNDSKSETSALSPINIAVFIAQHFGITPRFGIEREFYLIGGDSARFAVEASDRLADWTDMFLHCQYEAGLSQFEYALRETDDIRRLVETVRGCDALIAKAAHNAGGSISWSALPFVGQPSSGMHIHLTLHDHTGANLFAKANDSIDGPEPPILLVTIAGLLTTMRPLMIIFAPTNECYGRLVQRAYPEVQFAPSTVSWGPDNRSVALRLPACGYTPERRRIEHRLSSPMVSCENALCAILAGLWVGLTTKQAPIWPKTLGLANHPGHKAPLLLSSQLSAKLWFHRIGAPLLNLLSAQICGISLDPNSYELFPLAEHRECVV